MAENFGFTEVLRWEDGKLHHLPQDYADMFGWENQVKTVAEVYYNMNPMEQKKVVIIASNYGEAGAINYYHEKYNMPKAVNFSGSFYTWGAGNLPGEILIAVGFQREDFENLTEDVKLATTITHEFARENNVPVWICRNLKLTLQ